MIKFDSLYALAAVLPDIASLSLTCREQEPFQLRITSSNPTIFDIDPHQCQHRISTTKQDELWSLITPY